MDVILVDELDQQVGVMEKMEVHRKGILHRAFSVFVFNDKGEMLIHQRAHKKYHSANLWTNACCSHPLPGESTIDAANRRLEEEMGFSTKLDQAFTLTYKAQLENGLTEHELDHVFIGTYNGSVQPAPDEVQDYKYQSLDQIKNLLNHSPDLFTVWFRIIFPQIAICRESKD